jgi:hypothetical protein
MSPFLLQLVDFVGTTIVTIECEACGHERGSMRTEGTSRTSSKCTLADGHSAISGMDPIDC